MQNELSPPPAASPSGDSELLPGTHWTSGGFSVTLLPAIPGCTQAHDELFVLVPGKDAIVHIAYATDSGRNGMAYVSGDHVFLAPPRRRFAMQCETPSDAIVLRLTPGLLARGTDAGDAPSTFEVHAGPDVLLRETAALLRIALAAPAHPSHLGDIGEVVAAHIAARYGTERRTASHHSGLAPHQHRVVEALVREHLAEPLGVRRLAASIDMSVYHFSRMFKRATGWSPYFYITLERVKRAKQLLQDTDMSLTEVAVAVGLTSQGHFTEVFRKLTGETPRAFRQRQRDNAPAAAASGD